MRQAFRAPAGAKPVAVALEDLPDDVARGGSSSTPGRFAAARRRARRRRGVAGFPRGRRADDWNRVRRRAAVHADEAPWLRRDQHVFFFGQPRPVPWPAVSS
jgi:hypothetical protein